MENNNRSVSWYGLALVFSILGVILSIVGIREKPKEQKPVNEVKVVVMITNGVGNSVALEIPMRIWTNTDPVISNGSYHVWPATLH